MPKGTEEEHAMGESPRDNCVQKPPKSSMLGAYEIHYGALKRFISRLISSRQDVDDVVQEAFLRAYSAESNKIIDQPKPYLFRVARNIALNQLRQKSRKPTDYLEDAESPNVLASEFTLEDEIMAQQKLGIHCAAVATLPPKCRKVYLMRKVYAMTYKEIADALEITVSTVETHLEKAFVRCDAYVEKHLQGVDNRSTIAARKRGV